MNKIIEPKALKGFRDLLPAAEIERKTLIEGIERVFRAYGFVPIDTPALEYAEVLLGKSGGDTEKQIYRFKDNGGRDVALRFDLTVPFARFLAAHREELPIPFKRYHIAKVWRGENTQKGRYREFTQCDFDIVGSESVAADFEILLIMRETLRSAAGEVSIRLNHRGLFNRFLGALGIEEKSPEILRIVDKVSKIGREETARLLGEIVGEDAARKTLDFIEPRGDFEATLRSMEEAAGGPSPESGRLRALWRCMKDSGVEKTFVLDPSITRGLDYYTGVVFESFLPELPGIGSVCSGGRYDNLVGLYSKEPLSGVGASIGIDRLLAGLETLGRLENRKTYTELGALCLRDEDAGRAQALAAAFREQGVPCETLLPMPGAGEKQLVRQYMLAEKKGLTWLVIPGEGGLTLRNLAERKNREGLSLEEIVELVKSR